MAYEYKKIYDVAAEAGCETDKSNNLELHKRQLTKVRSWMRDNFSDIFEIPDIVEMSTFLRMEVYFKGTRLGISLIQDVTSSNNGYGVMRNSTDVRIASSSELILGAGNVRLLIIKSKHGFIAGFYNALVGIKNNVRTMAVNRGSYLSVINLQSATEVYAADGVGNFLQSPLMRASQMGDVRLEQYAPWTGGYVCENAYWNFGAGVGGGVLFAIEGHSGQYAALQGIEDYVQPVLKLEEPSAADYAGLTPIWT